MTRSTVISAIAALLSNAGGNTAADVRNALEAVLNAALVADEDGPDIVAAIDAALGSSAWQQAPTLDAANLSYVDVGGLGASNAQDAIDVLAARTGAELTAIIASPAAPDSVKTATAYVCGSDNGHTVIQQAIADGYRSLLLVGEIVAGSTVTIDTAQALDIAFHPGAQITGNLTISVDGARVRLSDSPADVVTGAFTDTHSRAKWPTWGTA